MRLSAVSALAATLTGCCVSPQQVQVYQTPRTKSTLVRMHRHTAAQIEKLTANKKKPGRHLGINLNRKAAKSGTVATSYDANQIEKVKETIAAKLGNPAFINFPDIAPGKGGSLCGAAEVRDASGQTRELAFVYLVQEDKLYIINGSDDLRASTAINRMCD